MSLKENQEFTVKTLTVGQSFTLIEPQSFYMRTKNGKSAEKVFKTGTFNYYLPENINGLCISYYIGPMTSSMSIESFFKKTKVKVLEAETPNDDFSDLVPKKGEITRIQNLGVYDTTYYQGGFPSHQNLVFSTSNEKQKKKAISGAKRMKTRTQIIPMLKAIKSVFGTSGYNSPFEIYMTKAEEIGITENEKLSIDKYSEKNSIHHNLSII
jgi:hypothetical protein